MNEVLIAVSVTAVVTGLATWLACRAWMRGSDARELADVAEFHRSISRNFLDQIHDARYQCIHLEKQLMALKARVAMPNGQEAKDD